MELLLLGLLFMGLFGDSSKDDKKAKERKRRRDEERRAYERRQRKYHEDLGYYEHLYGQGHP
jgi:hypothetical protein